MRTGLAKDRIAGAIHCPTYETGDPAKFTRALAEKIVARGGMLLTDTTIDGFEIAGQDVVGIRTSRGLVCDRTVRSSSRHAAAAPR
ncbi:FAD-dependent oxidoreductase [Paraburkholderia sediminicola]|uniref:FAD-dependent oxidoreductase n=1 Tax=Paraburkholderia sediminicola TaxID=458836 RepID=UPI0038BC15F0